MRENFAVRFGWVAALALTLAGCAQISAPPGVPAAGIIDTNARAMPTGQLLTPTGRQVDLPMMRPQALALSPDGSMLATAGKDKKLVLIDPATGTILTNVAMSFIPSGGSNRQAVTAELSATGLIFSPAGDRIYLSNGGGGASNCVSV